MKYSIIYSSQTGNGKLLAETIAKDLPQSDCDYMGSIKDVDSEVLFVGFWTDKGSCDETLASYLNNLHNKKIFLFGTAGFGGNQEYFDRILTNVKTHIDSSNTVVGTYMCQGKMPMAVHQHYEQMAIENPERFQPMIANFDKALCHPDNQDLAKLSQIIKQFH